ncbi:MAG: peptide ABC transporter ATP-binding protein [Candidatus Epulonipiscioides saccharophilum]|nr:MAG: peptide ABC transporter ATP-binding protein [Epulopiscium sp. AS2M-Bin001]
MHSSKRSEVYKLIRLQNIKMNFKSELDGSMQQVLKDVTFRVCEGDCLAVLGESGSGKSTLARILIGLLKPSAGTYYFLNQEPYRHKIDKKVLSENVSIVFQNYNTSVNPRFTVYEIIKESIDVLAHRTKVKIDAKSKVSAYLQVVGLDDSFLDRFPHQLSGGQLQRVCIARAVASEPRVIVFDEAISSLDAHTQVQIMDLLRKLQKEFHLTFIFITHDLTAVTYLCNRVMFLHNGIIEEILDVCDIGNAKSEYAKKLIDVVIEM